MVYPSPGFGPPAYHDRHHGTTEYNWSLLVLESARGLCDGVWVMAAETPKRTTNKPTTADGHKSHQDTILIHTPYWTSMQR